jgi:hypothetical protein
MVRDDSWIYRVTPDDRRELESALASVQRAGTPLLDIRRKDFSLPRFGATLQRLLHEIQHGRGFVLVRGLTEEGYSEDDLSVLYWGIGTHLGEPATQNADHHLLGHVRDEGRQFGQIDARGYHSNAHLDFHVDGCEIVALLCVQPAKSGGLSSIVSAAAIYNEILRHHPEHLPVLYRGFRYIKREAAFTSEPVSPHRLPVFGYAAGELSCRYVRTKIEAAYTKLGERPSDEEEAALDRVDALANDRRLRLDMDFQVGDIQLINNYTILHSRTEFEDWPEPERRRHLLRLWLTFREPRPLPDDFPRHLGYGRENSEIAYLTTWRDRSAAMAPAGR